MVPRYSPAILQIPDGRRCGPLPSTSLIRWTWPSPSPSWCLSRIQKTLEQQVVLKSQEKIMVLRCFEMFRDVLRCFKTFWDVLSWLNSEFKALSKTQCLAKWGCAKERSDMVTQSNGWHTEKQWWLLEVWKCPSCSWGITRYTNLEIAMQEGMNEFCGR